jgi:hypothetical protein
VLTAAELGHFVERGFVRVEGCFSRRFARELTDAACTRLFCDPADRATWPASRMRAPRSATYDAREIAPRAWQAACDLVGGADRVDQPYRWTDGFIVNFGREPALRWAPPGPVVRPEQAWHADGDFFRHFLDSPEQGLLVIALFSDIEERGGGTQLACDSVDHVARFLAAHPEGVLLGQIPADEIVSRCTDFAEVTGSIGDVFFLHPFMLHTWSVSERDTARFIINPPVTLRQPMRFDRPHDADHSAVERVVLRALGTDRFPFSPTGPHERIVPERLTAEQRQLDERRKATTGR